MIHFSNDMLYQPVLEFVQKFAPLRYKYAIQFHQKKDRYNVAMAYILLCMEKGHPVGEIFQGENGKPFISDSIESDYFSITHTNNLVAIVTSNQNVGIDSESCFQIDQEIIDIVCSSSEQCQIMLKPFLRTIFWTVKESLSKLLNEDWYSAPYTDLFYINDEIFDRRNPAINFEYYQLRENFICIASELSTDSEIQLVKDSDIMAFIMSI